MFIEKVGIFLLFLAPLIFFHELGHYLLAKWAKIKVETFSIGFGPKLLKFRKWGTEFTLSLIPLGGYVKMFGDNPETFGEIPHDMRHQAYQYKTIWQRFCVVFAGPLFNIILAFALFVWVFITPGEVQLLQISSPNKSLTQWCPNLKSGSVIESINGNKFMGFDDMNSWGWKIHSLSFSLPSLESNKGLTCQLPDVAVQSFLPALLESTQHTRPVFLKDQKEYTLSLANDGVKEISLEEILGILNSSTQSQELFLKNSERGEDTSVVFTPGADLFTTLLPSLLSMTSVMTLKFRSTSTLIKGCFL